MSTKGLMEDRRTKDVQVNEAGKACELTLADGWTYNGSAGPFPLDSVTHGHQIVKGAVNPDDPGRKRATRKPAKPKPAPGVAFGEEEAPTPAPAPPPVRRSGSGKFVYRAILFDTEKSHEVTGWIQSTYAYQPKRLEEATHHLLDHALRCAGGDPEAAEVRSHKWTAADEKKCREDKTAGSPWPMEEGS